MKIQRSRSSWPKVAGDNPTKKGRGKKKKFELDPEISRDGRARQNVIASKKSRL